MIRVNITKQSIITNSGLFPDQSEAEKWIEQEVLNKSFGEEGSYQIDFVDETIQQALIAESAAALTYLQSTDWIVSKISEAQILGQDISNLLLKYDDELALREAARAKVL